jgi:hypothetical protein
MQTKRLSFSISEIHTGDNLIELATQQEIIKELYSRAMAFHILSYEGKCCIKSVLIKMLKLLSHIKHNGYIFRIVLVCGF